MYPAPTPDASPRVIHVPSYFLDFFSINPNNRKMLPSSINFDPLLCTQPTNLLNTYYKKAQDPTSEALHQNDTIAIMSTPNPKAFPLANAQLTNQVCHYDFPSVEKGEYCMLMFRSSIWFSRLLTTSS